MPESFVQPAGPFKVERRVWSRRTRWGATAAPPHARLEASPPAAMPLLPGNQRTAWLLVVGCWTLVGLGYFDSRAIAMRSGVPIAWLRLLALTLGTAWIWASLTPAVLRLTWDATFVPGRRAQSVARYGLTGAGFFFASGVLQWVLGVVTRMNGPGLWTTVLSERLETRVLAYLAIIALGWSGRYFGLYRTRHLQASELEGRLAKTHLQVLKTQLQPHFLFNTLNTVAELVHTDPEAADQMITRLGRLLRLSLDHAGHQLVPLRQETDFLRVYIEIEQVRFQERLQVVWDLDPDTLEAAVPSMLWQPVVENAIRHGVTPLAGRGRVVIASRREGDDLVLEIRDNGRGLPPGGVPREGVGLRNIRERVAQLYGPRAHFSLRPALGGGTDATLRLPFAPCEGPHTPVPTQRSDPGELEG